MGRLKKLKVTVKAGLNCKDALQLFCSTADTNATYTVKVIREMVTFQSELNWMGQAI